MLPFALFLLFYLTCRAKEKRIITPYFKVKLPQNIISNIQTINPEDGLGKTYSYFGAKGEYLLAVFVKDAVKWDMPDQSALLVEDAEDMLFGYADTRAPNLMEVLDQAKVTNVKVEERDFKVLRAPDSRMETWATIHKGKFYRIGIFSDDPKTVDKLSKLITQSIQLTDTPITADVE